MLGNGPRSSSRQGDDGVAGFARGGTDVRLMDEQGRTTLVYQAKAEVGGKLAQFGSRLIQSTARKLAAKFFEALAEVVAQQDA